MAYTAGLPADVFSPVRISPYAGWIDQQVAGLSQVPEPTTAALLLAAGGCLMPRRRRG